MSGSTVLVDISHSLLKKKDVSNLVITVNDMTAAKATIKVKGNSQISFHNNTNWQLLIWVSRSEDSAHHDWEDLIKGSQSYVDDRGVISLKVGTKTKEKSMKIKTKNQPFSFWVHVNFGGLNAANGDDGGGLAQSAEIEVTPP